MRYAILLNRVLLKICVFLKRGIRAFDRLNEQQDIRTRDFPGIVFPAVCFRDAFDHKRAQAKPVVGVLHDDGPFTGIGEHFDLLSRVVGSLIRHRAKSQAPTVRPPNASK